MPIIRPILNNGFFVLLLIIAASLYIAYATEPNKATTAPKDVPIATDALASTQPTPPSAANSAHTASSTTPVVKTAEAITPLTRPKTSTQTEKTAVVTTKKVVDQVVASLAPAAQPATTTPPSSTTKKPSSTSTAKNQSPTKALTGNALLKQYTSFDQAIHAARQAFSKKDYEKAERLYFAMAFATKNPEVLGELGNLLYAEKKTVWATKFWIEAAKSLVRANHLNDALSFANRLVSISPQAAKEIRNHVKQVMKQQQQTRRQQQLANQKAEMAKQKQQKQQEKAKQVAYQKQMADYQARLKTYYQKQQAAQGIPSAKQQAARQAAYEKQMADYQAKMRAYYQRMHQGIQTPMPGYTMPPMMQAR